MKILQKIVQLTLVTGLFLPTAHGVKYQTDTQPYSFSIINNTNDSLEVQVANQIKSIESKQIQSFTIQVLMRGIVGPDDTTVTIKIGDQKISKRAGDLRNTLQKIVPVFGQKNTYDLQKVVPLKPIGTSTE